MLPKRWKLRANRGGGAWARSGGKDASKQNIIYIAPLNPAYWRGIQGTWLVNK